MTTTNLRACKNCRNTFRPTLAETLCSAACCRHVESLHQNAPSCDLCGATHADGVAIVADGERRVCVDCVGRG